MPEEELIFGGCLIKAMDASKVNLNDADTLAWSSTVRKIKAELPKTKCIVPGHGNTGGKELLDYTFELFDPSNTAISVH